MVAARHLRSEQAVQHPGDRTDALAGWSLAETLIAPKLATPVDDLIVAAEAKKRGKVFRP